MTKNDTEASRCRKDMCGDMLTAIDNMSKTYQIS
mgnify:CR=1 FL=1